MGDRVGERSEYRNRLCRVTTHIETTGRYEEKGARQQMEETECSETSEHKIQTPGNNPEESIQHLEHGEILKSRNIISLYRCNQIIYNVAVQSVYYEADIKLYMRLR